MTLATDARALVEAVNDVDRLNLEGDERDYTALVMLREAYRQLGYSIHELEQKLARRMDDKRLTIQGVGTFEKRAKAKRSKWDREALRSAVLDSRLCDEDGVIVEETPLERIEHVWLLGAPRVTALRERGIDPDQFCETEWDGYSISIIN